MERITKSVLRDSVARLNRYAETTEGNRFILSIVYGKYQLCKEEGSGERSFSYPMSAKELYLVLDTLENVFMHR